MGYPMEITYAWFAIALLSILVAEASIQVLLLNRAGLCHRLRHWFWETGASTLIISGPLLLLLELMGIYEVWVRMFAITLLLARSLHVFWLTRSSVLCKKVALQIEVVAIFGLILMLSVQLLSNSTSSLVTGAFSECHSQLAHFFVGKVGSEGRKAHEPTWFGSLPF